MAKFQFDEEGIKASLKSILEEIHDTDNPEELNELRRLFRKSVPLFSRAYVAAYLLKKARIPGAGDMPTRRPAAVAAAPVREARPPREPRQAREVREPRESNEARAVVEPGPARENMTTLFVGIGRTRRVYPRDLMGLLLDNCPIQKDHIGNIKILDNYSFVDIANEKAGDVIEKLNNMEFRGRTLSVNFAKKKE